MPSDATAARRIITPLRILLWLIAALALLVVGSGLYGVSEAMRTPRVAVHRIPTARWPAGRPPLRIVQITDPHAVWPFMTPARLQATVAAANALHPDLVVLTGDMTGRLPRDFGRVGTDDAVAPFAGLHARYGVFAVLGNHDWDRSAVAMQLALTRIGITVLMNRAVMVGPITLVGVGDPWTHHDQLDVALAGVDRGRPTVLLAHSPDLFPQVPPWVALTLAGHTHGGQILLPYYGPLATASHFGMRYLSGHRRERGHDLIVSPGVGTSDVPLRFGVPPQIELIVFGGSSLSESISSIQRPITAI